MFGGLKKKLQSALSKISKKVEPESEKPHEHVRDIREEKGEEKIKALENLQEEIEERKEELEEIEEKLKEEKIPEEKELLREEKEALEEVKAEIRSERVEEPTHDTLKEKPKKPGILRRMREKTLSASDIANILKELEIALLESDVAVEVAERISSDVKRMLIGKSVKRGKVFDVVKEALEIAIIDILDQETINIEERIREKNEKEMKPFLIMFIGFNGTGKTTTLAKLANRLKKYNPVIAAGDTFRAASIEQLEIHAKKLGLDLVKHRYGADSAAVIFDAVRHAQSSGSKVVLADTAGRSHANLNLMDELKKIVKVNKPDLKILVLDALTGNDIYDQARLFNDAIGVDAIILTKADVYEKGGSALSAAFTIRKPILFLGVGQEYGDLIPFEPEKIVRNLLA